MPDICDKLLAFSLTSTIPVDVSVTVTFTLEMPDATSASPFADSDTFRAISVAATLAPETLFDTSLIVTLCSSTEEDNRYP